MNLLNSQNHKQLQPSSKTNKKRLNHDQVRLLELSFDAGRKLDPERKYALARELGVPPRQIAIWYQNKRARWKNQSLELDYGALQLRLDNALAEKRQLERDVENLRGELKKAQDMLLMSRQQAQSLTCPPVSSLSSCCDDGSSLNDESCSLANGETLQFEELYALMMGAKDSNSGPSAFNGKDYWA